MRFKDFAQYLLKLEKTSKRLEITDILADLIQKLDVEEIDKAVFLMMGQLKALFENNKFNIAEKMMVKILEFTYSSPEKIYTNDEITKTFNKIGDLGDTAFELADKISASTPGGLKIIKSNLTILQVYERLYEIASIEGSGSQEAKTKKAALLLKELDSLSAKYAVRIILGTLRLGFTELTFISALAQFLGDKSLGAQIEGVYSIHPDIGLIAKKLKQKGIRGITEITIEPGVPVLSQKAQRLGSAEEAIEKMQLVWAEYKFDGTRVQLHINRDKQVKSNKDDQSSLFGTKSAGYLTKTYTRNLEETTHQYPDIIEAADKQIDARSAILDGEAIGYDRKTGEFLPFQETIQRKRKHDVANSVKNIPLKYFVFDILYLNGKTLINKSLRERKKLLIEIIKPGETITVDEYLETNDPEKLHEYYETAKEKGLEGVIAKKPEDPYQAGGRSFSWVKLKRADEKLLEDSVDCVVLGYYAGRGVRSKFGIGGFLAGVYDKKTDSFKTITKVGTGLTEDTLMKLKAMCDKIKTDKIPANVEMDKTYTPDVIVQPKIVIELGADEISDSPSHSAGFALRFPRLIKFREDKNPTEATTVEEIKQMHKRQKRGSY